MEKKITEKEERALDHLWLCFELSDEAAEKLALLEYHLGVCPEEIEKLWEKALAEDPALRAKLEKVIAEQRCAESS